MSEKLFFKHDVYALEDRPLRKLVQKYQASGYAVFFVALEFFYKDNGTEIAVEDLACDVADKLHNDSERVAEILQDCVQFGLFKSQDNMIYSERVKEACKELEDYYSRQKINASKGGIAKAKKARECQENNQYMPSGRKQTCQVAENKPANKEKIREEEEKSNINNTNNISKRDGENNNNNNSLPSITCLDESIFNVTHNYLRLKQETFKKVDVLKEFMKMQALTEVTPQRRPSSLQINNWVDRWLQNEQNDIERRELKNQERSKDHSHMTDAEIQELAEIGDKF